MTQSLYNRKQFSFHNRKTNHRLFSFSLTIQCLPLSSIVEMKERNSSSSTLRRILVNCAAQAKEYGGCVAAKVPEIERDMCLKEFLALKNCMQNTIRGKA
uniref:IMS import disulfide relay-system CHCH-CHCH-like Cx9C domain-containing protein n=1 Tax=Populus trichocarpa TaxID=3694 RepID=A0A3N7F3Y8_POPTR